MWPLRALPTLFLILKGCTGVEVDERRLYTGVQILRTAPTGVEEEELIQSLADSVEVTQVVWENTTYLDLVVIPNLINLVTQLLNCSNIQYQILIPDLQKSIDEENIEAPSDNQPQFKSSCSATSGLNWNKYYDYQTISNYMDCLASQFGHIAQMFQIGTTTEGRPLKVVKVGLGGRGHRKPAIWIDGGIHAREWISPATVTYILDQLVENNDAHMSILDSHDIYLMPSMNPDGYEYSRNTDRLWRKTRSQNSGTTCRGADPNRNWGYRWGEKGASTNPCSETYRGPAAFSEPETAAVRDFILARKRNLQMYLTFHSYGQMVLYPWGYDREDHEDEGELERVGQIGNAAMSNKYTVGSAAKVLYPAAGGSDDWAKGGAGIRYSYTIELPDTGNYGFVLPASQIIPVAKEALAATLAMISAIQA